MKASLVLGAGRGLRLEILERIKRSGAGLSVKELSAELGMSYMGVKAHCSVLASEGCVASFRRPSSTSSGTSKGRPTMIYRISQSGERLFSEPESDFPSLLLQEASTLYGPTAAQKILVMAFRSLARRYASIVGVGTPIERALLFAKARDREGRMSEFIKGNPWEIRESSPLNKRLQLDFPEICTLEAHLVSEVLGLPILREETQGMVRFRPS